VFYAGSVAKQFTGFAVALLANEGRLALDDDVRRHIPELPRYDRPITIRHLLHHTGGLRDYGELTSLAGRPQESLATNDDVIDLLSRQRAPFFAAGSEYLYSNTGYNVLGSIVARASGMPFAAFTSQRIFQPLGMTDSRFNDDVDAVIRHRASAYRPRQSGGFSLDFPNNARVGQGGLYTTVLDLAKWDQNFYDAAVGGADLVRQMRRMPPEMQGIPGTLNPNETGSEYGFGIFSTKYRGLDVVQHGGGFGGYRATLIRFPAQRFSVALLCNLGTIDPAALVRAVADIYLSDQLGPRPASIPWDPPPPFPLPAVEAIPLSPADLEQYTGTFYSQELDVTVTVVVRGAELQSLRGRTRIGLRPFTRDGFLAGTAVVRFERDGADQISGLRLDAGRTRNIGFVRR
jgi:CubicO group peptidase (beta-lactamase class C family)